MVSIEGKVAEALQLHKQGQIIDAEALYCNILKEYPKNTDTLNLLGLLNLQNNKFKEAINYIQTALELRPCTYYLESLGKAYFGADNFIEAINCYKKVLELIPNNFSAQFNLALAYRKNNQLDKSISAYKKALLINSNNPDVYFNLANIYENKNDTPNALKYYNKAYENGIIYDNIKYFIGVSYLKVKDFENGWKYYEHRPSFPFSIKTQEHQLKDLIIPKPIWSGEDINDKTLYVYYEAGLGDSLMYARYLPLLKNKCKKVLFKPQSSLVTLFEANDFDVEIIDYKTPLDKFIFDTHIPIMSLPYALKLNSESEIPYPEGFLKSNPEKALQYRKKYFTNNKFKIGIKWQGNLAYDRNRIIPLEAFYKIFDLPNIQFYSLQKDDCAEALAKLPKKYDVIDLGPSFNDFSDTAAAIENMDLVICNDTSVAHLVAAMGKECWIMLPYISNWRWHTDTTYSPWYKTVKLFKQTELNNWNDIFSRVYEKLRKVIQE